MLYTCAHCRDSVCANARFLGLAGCRTEADTDTRLGRILDDFVATLKAKGKDRLFHRLHPNHLATLAVYFHLFVDKRRAQKSQYHKYVMGLMPRYIPGDEIQSKEHLASQSLPIHYRDSDAVQLAVRESPCQAIASPATKASQAETC